MESASFLLAFLAGVVVVLSPCILPILPILLASMVKGNRWYPVYLVGGMVITFTILGTLFGAFGHVLGISKQALNTVAIWILFAMGIVMLVPFLDRAFTKLLLPLEKIGAGGPQDVKRPWDALVLGIITAIIWVPCTGPVLASILTLAASQENIVGAGLLLFVYTLGAGIPILAVSYGGNRVSARLQFFKTHPEAVKRTFGVILILAAIVLKFSLLRYVELLILPVFLPIQEFIGL